MNIVVRGDGTIWVNGKKLDITGTKFKTNTYYSGVPPLNFGVGDMWINSATGSMAEAKLVTIDDEPRIVWFDVSGDTVKNQEFEAVSVIIASVLNQMADAVDTAVQSVGGGTSGTITRSVILATPSIVNVTGVSCSVEARILDAGVYNVATLRYKVATIDSNGEKVVRADNVVPKIGGEVLVIPITGLSRNTGYTVELTCYKPDTPLSFTPVVKTVSFTTSSVYIETPVITLPAANALFNTGFKVAVSPFTVTGGTDTHEKTRVVIKKTDGAIVSNTEVLTNKTSFTLPSNVMDKNTSYILEISRKGIALGWSAVGTVNFTTVDMLEIEYLLVGGGGNTRASGNMPDGAHSGGASGGEVLQGIKTIIVGNYNIIIGASASSSSAFGYTARAGNSASTEGRTGSYFPGATGWNGASASNGGDARYEAAAAGQDGVIWLDGVKYAPGGGGASNAAPAAGGAVGGGRGVLTGGTPTSAQNGAANTGAGAGGVYAGYGSASAYAYGGSGVFKFRYPGTEVKHTGGTYTISGGYVWVTFTTSGTLTITKV